MMIEGYAALFGVADEARDIVRAGAFRESLARRTTPLPMLLEHQVKALAGFWSEAREDGRGLFVRGEIAADQPGGFRARRALARGVDGLSIGFVPIAARRTRDGRVLEQIDLLEVSIVAFPMQPQARLNLARGFIRAVA